MTELTILSEKELTKERMDTLVSRVESEVQNGHIDPLELHIKARYISDLTSRISDFAKPLAVDKALEYNKEDRNLAGASFFTRNSADVLDYESDQEYQKIKDQVKEMEDLVFQDPGYIALKESLKDREEKLKKAHKMADDGHMFMDENAEVVEPPKVKSFGKTSIVVQFK